MYKLIYTAIEHNGSWTRARGKETETVLRRMINIANTEQDKYDSSHIQDGQHQTVWEPSLGHIGQRK